MYIVKIIPRSYYTLRVNCNSDKMYDRNKYYDDIRKQVPDFNLDKCYKFGLIANFYILKSKLNNGYDIDNLEKALKDALKPKLGIDDQLIYRSLTEKIPVETTDEERIEFDINQIGLSFLGERVKEIAKYYIKSKKEGYEIHKKDIANYLNSSISTIDKIIKTDLFKTICFENNIIDLPLRRIKDSNNNITDNKRTKIDDSIPGNIGVNNISYRYDIRAQKEEIIDQYLNGKSVYALRIEYNCSSTHIKKILTEEGIEIRVSGPRNKRS